MATIDDVAKRAGVAKSSVSRVLNGNFEYMSENLKTKILLAIKELDYSPNKLAQSLKKKSTHVIGIVLSDISNPFWSEVLKGVQEECMRSGYSVMVSSSGENPQIEKENILMLKNRQVDGLIVNTTGRNTNFFQNLDHNKLPFVFLDRSFAELKADAVVVNNLLGSREAIQHLINQGHRRIGIVIYSTNHLSPRVDRLEGYKQALTNNGIMVDESLIKVCSIKRGEGTTATLDLLSLPNPPSAIFSTHTFLNLEVLTGIKKANLRIPKDVSIIGYDDYPWVPLLDPPLSTVSQPAFVMGVQAAKLLINKMNSKRKRKQQIIQLEPKLIIRESSSPPSFFEKNI